MTHPQTWSGRLAASNEIDVRPVPEGRRGMTPGESMLYPSAQMVNDAIRAIPEGQSVSTRDLRLELARQHNADYTCPVTTTMMLRIVAEAANESHTAGASLTEVTPVWRVLDKNASALRKLTFDPAYLLEQREREDLSSERSRTRASDELT
ncbi:MAG: hypothetical protein ACR2GI_04850 [Thermomicrobiales bacterium]